MSTPLVSLVMSTCNGEKYVVGAIQSILAQTFTDYEFIIIDDGSTDNTWQVLSQLPDKHLRLIRNESNIGLTRSLNKALALAQGKYLARMDDDDLSLPERLEKQVTFLQAHPETALVGTSAAFIDESGRKQEDNIVQASCLSLKWLLLFQMPFVHPSLMWRKEIVHDRVGGYDESLPFAQDYDLVTRIAAELPVANLPEVLLHYRRRPGAISSQRQKEQKDIAAAISRLSIQSLLSQKKTAEQLSWIGDIGLCRPGSIPLREVIRAFRSFKELYILFCEKNGLTLGEHSHDKANISRFAGQSVKQLIKRLLREAPFMAAVVTAEVLRWDVHLLARREDHTDPSSL
jgi:glycosyltransferase involved in cell wall biosynthesis